MAVIPAPPSREALERVRRRLEFERYYSDSFVGCRVPTGGRCGDVLVKLDNEPNGAVGWVPWELLPLPCPTGLDGGLFDTIFDHGTDGGAPDTTFGVGEVHDGGRPSDP